MKSNRVIGLALMCSGLIPSVVAGPYSSGMNDGLNPFDAPVPGFTGPDGMGLARLDDGTGNYQNLRNRVNPLFFAWAETCTSYQRSDNDSGFSETNYALGPVTGDNFDVVSLGDLTAAQIAAGKSPGSITLRFAKPIKDLSGADFVIFENGFTSGFDTGGSGTGGMFAELAYVEVSADGVNFRRFNPISLTPAGVGAYGSINATDVHNLAGKHVNAYGDCWGTPFDISQTGLGEVTHIRLVDIPGNGTFKDSAGNPIYDSWRTIGSGGFDLEAIGSISTMMTFPKWPVLERLPAAQRGAEADPDGDGITNLMEYAYGLLPDAWDAPGSGWSHLIVNVGGQGYFEIVTSRDERLTDLIREVQVSEDLVNWTTLARSSAGSPFVPQNGFTPEISDSHAGDIASVGVLRHDHIRDSRPLSTTVMRYYQLKVTLSTP